MSSELLGTEVRPSAWRLRLRALGIESHVTIPVIVLIVGSCLLLGLHGDQVVAAWIYGWEGHQWALKDSWLTEQLVHKGGRNLSIGAGLAALLATIASEWVPRLAAWRRPMFRLFVSVALSTIIVSLVKKVSGMDCPWDLTTFGGPNEPFGFFDARPAGYRASGCFPAGHASAGYSWLALYFLALEAKPRLRFVGLGVGVGLGMIFGISQQLRGAHFLSHDLWTAAICWFVALGLYLIWPARPKN
ncbi:phosphatase PAP2 family protein [Stenotrophomonas sp. 2MCAF14_2]|uniref:phosphatase PAP2 family protein n=1 Tax=Stenotrophomonas sp. 2MCAF14_2 TaxID=3232983 RepID=UPI001EB818A3|nr:phosphatase PAP2 family protein [Stenotrophomonas maltophilia]